ncbi:MAG: A/G-specific adenine glycosylase [Flavipsychrobacter sp.]|jgi:A/G-specific adenine glycosylase|nr:A/G-specific adenine glycosylase [Flavipsychrobacter sp.]
MDSNKSKKYFTKQLKEWHASENTRSLPWKSEKDPYKIWLSEVILQQTRALQGLPYYLRFVEQYPTVHALAGAVDEEAFRLWQGLGYYNRCKNMLATARMIVKDFGGKFPGTYEQLLILKGIGPYTAAAIASFAYGEPKAVVDGNVYRVLSRCFGIDTPFDITEGKKQFASLAQELLDVNNSAAYNQAIMDLGATVCTPRNAQCSICPIQKKCIAFNSQIVGLLPIKSKKLVVKKRYFHYLLFKYDGSIWIHKRTGNDIWENLHEPFLIEHTQPIDLKSITSHNSLIKSNIPPEIVIYEGSSSQRLTHQIIEARFFGITLKKRPAFLNRSGSWVPVGDLHKMAFPKTVVSFLKNNLYF